MNPSHNSHTHCQVAQTEAQAKTWQRVCLSNRTTDRQTDEKKEALGGNRRLAQWRVKCFYDSLVQSSSFVLLMNICSNNPPLRQAPNRYLPFKKTTF